MWIDCQRMLHLFIYYSTAIYLAFKQDIYFLLKTAEPKHYYSNEGKQFLSKRTNAVYTQEDNVDVGGSKEKILKNSKVVVLEQDIFHPPQACNQDSGYGWVTIFSG